MAKKRVHRPPGSSGPARPVPKPKTSAAGNAAPVRGGSGVAPSGASRRPAQRSTTMMPRLSPARQRFEDLSRPWLLRMQALPTFVIPVLMAVLLFLGLVLPYWWAGFALLAIGLFLNWLTAVSWPGISGASRALRVVVDVSVLGLAVLRLLGRF